MPPCPASKSSIRSPLRGASRAFVRCCLWVTLAVGVAGPAVATAEGMRIPADAVSAPSPSTRADILEELQRDIKAGHWRHAGRKPRQAGTAQLAELPSYGMAYMRSGTLAAGAGVPTQKAADLRSLYQAAVPGYGVYTFILLGRQFPSLPEGDVARYRELLRLIQAYVLGVGGSSSGPAPDANAFLLAVYPWRSGQPLIEQTGPRLSDPLRVALASYADARGDGILAQRLAAGAGPFLVSSPEPRLIPADPTSPRLVLDLSSVALDDLYPVVDAYDQKVETPDGPPGAAIGTIRGRVARLLQGGLDTGGPEGGDGQCVFALGDVPVPVAGQGDPAPASSDPPERIVPSPADHPATGAQTQGDLAARSRGGT